MLAENKCVFLDRDGVLNESLVISGKPYAPTQKSEFKITNGSIDAINKIKKKGFLTIIVTNQPDLVTGKLEKHTLDFFHKKLITLMPIDDIFICAHVDRDKCSCRKPKPGLIFKAASKYNINLSKSYMIGDRWRDVDCAKEAGLRSIFIDHRYNEKLNNVPDFTIFTIRDAINCIV